MTTPSRAKINVGTSSIELEGSESFVTTHLEMFHSMIESMKVLSKSSFIQDDAKSQAIEKKDKTSKSEKRPKKVAPPIKPEEFEMSASGTCPSLEDFIKSKLPSGGSALNHILVIAYYIKAYKGRETFTEGNIEYAFKMLKLKNRPHHLRQSIVNGKNKQLYFNEAEGGNCWEIARAGELYVEDKLPLAEIKKQENQ